MYMTEIKDFKKVDKIEELGNKICKLVKYYERKDGYSHVLQVATLADVLITIREILKSYDRRFKELEKHNLEYHEINETGGANNIKIVLDDPKSKKEGS